MSLDFSGCRAKIGRAYEHHEALQSFLQDTFAVESNRVGVRIQFDMKATPGIGDRVTPQPLARPHLLGFVVQGIIGFYIT
jgi:hypothetical protein